MKMLRRYIAQQPGARWRVSALLVVLALTVMPAAAEVVATDTLATDTTVVATMAADSVAPKKPGFFKRLINSITQGHVDHTHDRAIDLSFVMYPSYSHEPGFGIGGALTGLYRIDRTDSIMEPSDCFLSFNASLRGFFQVYIKGNNLFPNGRSRINYVAEFYRMPLDFWGITAAETNRNEKSKYDRYMADIQANFAHEIVSHLYIGARLRTNFTAANKIVNPEYLLGERHSIYVTGIGALIEYDNRDNLLSPTRGFHVLYRPAFYWKVLGNAPASFWNHTVIANAYTPMWRGAVMAFDLYGSFNSSQTPWTMREMVASDGMRMRGYYMGSYMDNSQIAAQAEYRQHIYKRLGCTLWGGCATMFDRFGDLRKGSGKAVWLPNAGVGLRFEIKHNANIRLDCGFGKRGMGITFAFGEAF